MFNSLIYVLIVILSLKTIVNVAKTHDDVKNNNTFPAVDSVLNKNTASSELNPSMFTEGGTVNKILNNDSNSTSKKLSRNRNRNNLEEPWHQTVAEANQTSNATSGDVVKKDSATFSPSPAPSTSTTTLKTKLDKNQTIGGSVGNVTVSTILVSTTTLSTTTTTSTTTVPTSTTTQKHKKPVLTKSADDDPTILDNEKKIKFVNWKTEQQNTPKIGFDTDRAIDEEKHARHSYALFMTVAFGLPMTFVVVHILYKKIKAYMEVRHYQRVDFLVDGMYIS